MKCDSVTKPYKFSWSAVGTANQVASLRITRPGVITAISFSLMGVSGVGSTTTTQQIEVSMLTAQSIQQNDAPPSVLAETVIGYTVANAVSALSQVVPGLRVPVNAGDLINVHQVATNGSPASCSHNVMLYVDSDP